MKFLHWRNFVIAVSVLLSVCRQDSVSSFSSSLFFSTIHFNVTVRLPICCWLLHCRWQICLRLKQNFHQPLQTTKYHTLFSQNLITQSLRVAALYLWRCTLKTSKYRPNMSWMEVNNVWWCKITLPRMPLFNDACRHYSVMKWHFFQVTLIT